MRVEMDPKALNRFVYELVRDGGDASSLKFQWHSHVLLPAYFSAEDLETIAGYLNDYMISFVGNQQDEYRCRLDLFKPFQLSLELPLLVRVPPPGQELVRQYQDEIRQLVRVRSLLRPGGKGINIPNSDQSETLLAAEDVDDADIVEGGEQIGL